jgi:hypothetical protein
MNFTVKAREKGQQARGVFSNPPMRRIKSLQSLSSGCLTLSCLLLHLFFHLQLESGLDPQIPCVSVQAFSDCAPANLHCKKGQ